MRGGVRCCLACDFDKARTLSGWSRCALFWLVETLFGERPFWRVLVSSRRLKIRPLGGKAVPAPATMTTWTVSSYGDRGPRHTDGDDIK